MQPNAFSRGVSGARRTGFTLIELLVVLAIMTILVTLIVAATMKFRDIAANDAAKSQAKRLQLKLNEEYNAVVAQCQKNPPPDAVLTFCEGNPDRARAVHTAATLRTNFPQTFAEAATPFNINGFPYQPKVTFKSVWGVTGGTADQESAVLLYLILTERSVAGGSAAGETASASEKGTVRLGPPMNLKDFDVFTDNRGTPVIYSRWMQNKELDAAPYAHPSPAGSIDPLDPKNLVSTWSNASNLSILNGAQLNLQFGPGSHNRVPSVLSFGKDKQFDFFLPQGAALPSPPAPAGAKSSGDDILGYQFNRQGD